MATVKELALTALPHLVDFAQKRQTVTYSELCALIHSGHGPMNRALNYIRDDLCEPNKLPIISVIVVSKGSKLPGDEYLAPGHPAHGQELRSRC